MAVNIKIAQCSLWKTGTVFCRNIHTERYGFPQNSNFHSNHHEYPKLCTQNDLRCNLPYLLL
jgi:hypothetical protein